jgi:hypothetical protein
MKKSLLVSAILVAGALVLLTGCVERRVVYVQGPPPGTVVAEAPPAPPAEVVTVAPGPGYVWVGGNWSWQGRWVWIPGYWAARPHPHAVWVGGHWAPHARGYIWVGGHWR